MKDILIITKKDDAHADLLEPRLKKMSDFRILRINTEEFLGRETATLFVGAEKKTFLGGAEVNPVACWYRRPAPSILKNSVIPSVQEFIKSESTLFWTNFFNQINPDILWVNHPAILSVASVKSNQLMVAHANGLRIPDTIITNDPNAAESFCTQHKWNVIAKTIGAPVVKVDGANKNTYARRLSADKAGQLQNIKACPTILQEYIASKCELRVTVIGNKSFAVAIDFDKSKHTDWRGLPDSEIIYRDVELDSNVAHSALSLVKNFGLTFSTMDLVEDEEGRWFFLDLNPNGQWLWLDKHSRQGIADYFVRFLTKND